MIVQRLRAPALVAALALAACGGGGGAHSIPSAVATNAPAAGAGGTGTLGIAITVPGTSSASTARAPRYVSPNTASMTIALQGASSPLATVNLTPGSPGCSPVPLGTLCTVSVNAPVGTNSYIVTTYSAVNAGGSQLSTATLPETVTVNATNSLALILNGVDANATVILGTTSIGVGTPTSVSVTVVATDASGNVIVGPGNYSTPITLTDNDATFATTLTSGSSSGTTATITAPGQTVSLAYNGGSSLGATITPTIGSTTGTAATLTPTGYAVTNYSAPGSDTNELDGEMTVGLGGNLWYGTYGTIGSITSSGQFSEYSGLYGVPSAQISGMAADVSGNVWFGTTNGLIGWISPAGTATTVTSITYQGNTQTYVGAAVTWMTLGPDGNIWFSDALCGCVGIVYTNGVNAMTAAEWNLVPLGATEPDPGQLAFGPDGKLYAADFENSIDQITIAGGQPQAVVQATTPSGCATEALAIGPDNNVWFTDNCANVGVVTPVTPFSSSGMQMWTLSGVTDDDAIYGLTSSPGGLWGTDDYTNTVYRITNLAAVSGGFTTTTGSVRRPAILAATPAPPSLPPTVIPVNVFTSDVGAYSIALGGDGNIWTAADYGGCSAAPPSFAKIVYGAAGTGAQSTALKLGPLSHARARNAGRQPAQATRRQKGGC